MLKTMQCKLIALLIAVFKVLGLRPRLTFEGKKPVKEYLRVQCMMECDQGALVEQF